MKSKISKVTTNILKKPLKKIIDQLLMTKEAVDHAMIRLVKPINRACYSVKRSVVDFSNEQHCSCTCHDLKTIG